MGSHFAGTFSCLMRTISKARQYRLEGLEGGSATDSASWILKCFLKRLFDVTGPVKIWSPYFPFFFSRTPSCVADKYIYRYADEDFQ